VLTGIVLASSLARSVVAFVRQTPTYFPDEYLYSAISRSIAETGHPLVRGASAHLPSLLAPFLTAPAWLIGDTRVAYVVAQLLSAIAMSLAAVPVYALCRALRLHHGVALGAAALTVSVPGMMYATTLIAEPFAYPLALAAIAAGTVALGRGERGAQIAFLVLAAAATLARAQLLLIPLAYITATLIVGLRSRSLRAVARKQAWVLGGLALPLVALPLVPRVLGIYGHSEAIALGHGGAMSAFARNGLVLLYASGWLIVPGAVVGLAGAILRPRSQTELAFGALAVTFGIGALLQASVWGETDRPQERYVIYAIPLLAAGFGLTVDRGWPWRRAHGLLVAATIAIAASVPLSGYAASTIKEHSPTLWGVAMIEERLGTATGALTITLVATVLSLVALGLPLLSARHGTLLGIGLASAACLAFALPASKLDVRVSDRARDSSLPAERSWVDDAHVGNVTFLRDGGSRGDAFSQLIWNRSVRRVLLMPHATPLDVVDKRPVNVAPDGTLLVAGQAVTGPLLVDEYVSAMRFRGARSIASSPADELLVPSGRAQLELLASGFFRDGALAGSGFIALWPARPGGLVQGHLSFRVEAPTSFDNPVTLRLTDPGGSSLRVRVFPGARRTVSMSVCAKGPWVAKFDADHVVWIGGRTLSLDTTPPRWRPDSHPCAGA